MPQISYRCATLAKNQKIVESWGVSYIFEPFEKGLTPECPKGGLFMPRMKMSVKKGIIWGISIHSIHNGEVLFFSSVYI